MIHHYQPPSVPVGLNPSNLLQILVQHLIRIVKRPEEVHSSSSLLYLTENVDKLGSIGIRMAPPLPEINLFYFSVREVFKKKCNIFYIRGGVKISLCYTFVFQKHGLRWPNIAL